MSAQLTFPVPTLVQLTATFQPMPVSNPSSLTLTKLVRVSDRTLTSWLPHLAQLPTAVLPSPTVSHPTPISQHPSKPTPTMTVGQGLNSFQAASSQA